jgi:hypothetical protein
VSTIADEQASTRRRPRKPLLIKATRFNRSRLAPLHETARAGLERYLQLRRLYQPSIQLVSRSVALAMW